MIASSASVSTTTTNVPTGMGILPLSDTPSARSPQRNPDCGPFSPRHGPFAHNQPHQCEDYISARPALRK